MVISFFLILAAIILLLVNADEGIINPHRWNIDRETLKLLVPISRYAQISYCLGTLENIRQPFVCRYGCTQFPESKLLFAWWEDSLFDSPIAGYFVDDPKNKQLILMFRGAHSISDVIHSFQFQMTDFIPFGTDPEKWNSPNENPFYCNETVTDRLTGRYINMGCKVHRGIQHMYLKTMEMCSRFVSDTVKDPAYADYRFVIAGHSLGGIIATMAGADFKMRGYSPTVISFGSPKFGNRGFTKWFDELFETQAHENSLITSQRSYFRVTKKHDAYTHFPLSRNYAHTSGEVFISDCDDPEPRENTVYFCAGQDNSFCSHKTKANPISVLFTEPIHMNYFTDMHGCALEHSYVPIRDVPPPHDENNPY